MSPTRRTRRRRHVHRSGGLVDGAGQGTQGHGRCASQPTVPALRSRPWDRGCPAGGPHVSLVGHQLLCPVWVTHLTIHDLDEPGSVGAAGRAQIGHPVADGIPQASCSWAAHFSIMRPARSPAPAGNRLDIGPCLESAKQARRPPHGRRCRSPGSVDVLVPPLRRYRAKAFPARKAASQGSWALR